MLWNKRKLSETFRAVEAPPDQSGCRVADPDRALDAVGRLLKTYARFAFDTDQAAAHTREACEQWAQRIVLGEVKRQDDTEKSRASALVRDWSGLYRFFDDQRKQESDYVTRSLGGLRQSVLSLASCLSGTAGHDQDSDAQVERRLHALSGALAEGDVTSIAAAASAVIDTARETMAQRREREAEHVVQLGEQLRQLREELSEECKAAAADELTGLFGRAAFEQQLEQLAAIGMLLEQRPSLILIDVDEPKRAVEQHRSVSQERSATQQRSGASQQRSGASQQRSGASQQRSAEPRAQPADDDVLREMSKCASRTFLRKQDFVARSGPKEFGVLLVDMTEEQLLAAVERVLKGARKLHIEPTHGGAASITVSIGVAQLRANEDASRWRSRATLALQRAKEDGGDGYELSRG